MKNRSILVIILAIFSISLVFALYQYSIFFNHQENSFVRLTPLNILGVPKVMDLKYNSYYFAGQTSAHIFLGNYTAPTHVIRSNYFLTDTAHLRIKLPIADSVAWKALVINIDSSFVFLSEYITPSVLTGEISDTVKHHSINLRSVNFIQPISSSSFVVRQFDSDLKSNVLSKANLASNSSIVSKDVLEKQIDGLFCTDGILHYNKETSQLLYVYYYRNSFLRLDTNLNVIIKGKTIDTVNHARLKVAHLADGTTSLSAPPLTVNRRSNVFDKFIYINSTLLAKNEDRTSLDARSVIDVYSIENGYYQFSFYIPYYKGKEMDSFKVVNGRLIALFDQYILSYSLNLDHFDF